MRAILINHSHPQMPHVSAARARDFASALADRGHRIVLVTESLERGDAPETPDSFLRRLSEHDWSTPIHLACPPRGGALLEAQRRGKLPRVASRLVVALSYWTTGSVFSDWGRGVAPHEESLARVFSPDVVWATFGNTEALRIAERLARRAGCPWVLDVKDFWSSFVPPPLSARLARRFRGACRATALSEGHAKEAERHFGRAATVVYSGLPDSIAANEPPVTVNPNRITITGAIYDGSWLERLISGIGAAAHGTPFELDYAGREGALVTECADGRPGIAKVTDHGFISLDALHGLQRSALANAFVRSGPGWFQHKIPELIAAGRPVVCLPAADAETRSMCENAGVPFHGCDTAEDVAAAVSDIRDRREAGSETIAPRGVADLTWRARAAALEKVLLDACR